VTPDEQEQHYQQHGEEIVGKVCHGDTHEDRILEWFNFCGCGQPETMLTLLHAVLREFAKRHSGPDGEWEQSWRNIETLLHGKETPGLYYTYLNWMDGHELIEHGGGIGGSWLTDKGRAMLVVLDAWEPES
jgi:hypothetical protein